MLFEDFPLHVSLSAAPNCRIPMEFVDLTPTLNIFLDRHPPNGGLEKKKKAWQEKKFGCLRIIFHRIVLGASGILDKLQHFDLDNTFFFSFKNLCLGTIKIPLNIHKPRVKTSHLLFINILPCTILLSEVCAHSFTCTLLLCSLIYGFLPHLLLVNHQGFYVPRSQQLAIKSTESCSK